MTSWVHPRPSGASDVTRTSFRLHERLQACVDGWERFMVEVLSKMRASMIVLQGNPLLATGLCLPTAHCCIPVTPRPFPYRTIALSRLCLAAKQTASCASKMVTSESGRPADWRATMSRV